MDDVAEGPEERPELLSPCLRLCEREPVAEKLAGVTQR
jgi:hypothetical protein